MTLAELACELEGALAARSSKPVLSLANEGLPPNGVVWECHPLSVAVTVKATAADVTGNIGQSALHLNKQEARAYLCWLRAGNMGTPAYWRFNHYWGRQ